MVFDLSLWLLFCLSEGKQIIKINVKAAVGLAKVFCFFAFSGIMITQTMKSLNLLNCVVQQNVKRQVYSQPGVWTNFPNHRYALILGFCQKLTSSLFLSFFVPLYTCLTDFPFLLSSLKPIYKLIYLSPCLIPILVTKTFCFFV